MTASLLHFGQEVSNRFPLLRRAGYSVTRFVTLLEFQDALHSGVEHDAVSVSDLEEYPSAFAAHAARFHSAAPLILFRTPSLVSFFHTAVEPVAAISDAHFDLVIPAGASSLDWMTDLEAVIARSRATLNQTGRLCEELTAAGVQLRAEIARSRIERARNADLGVSFAEFGIGALGNGAERNGAHGNGTHRSGPIVDKLLTCSHCGVEFVFSAGEQLFFQSRNFQNNPMRCRKCRNEGRRAKSSGATETVVICASCGVSTRVPFRPTQGRPVLCRACFDKQRRA